MEFKDEVITHSTTYVSWGDRLRILFYGKVFTSVRVQTENEVGATASAVVAFAPDFPVRRWWNKKREMATAASPRASTLHK